MTDGESERENRVTDGVRFFLRLNGRTGSAEEPLGRRGKDSGRQP